MADVRVLDKKTGVERTFTRASWNFQKSSGRYELLESNYETEKVVPAKKKETVKDVAEVKADVADDVDGIEALRKEYLELSGDESIDGRWKEPRLKEEINKLK